MSEAEAERERKPEYDQPSLNSPVSPGATFQNFGRLAVFSLKPSTEKEELLTETKIS